jgi:acyl-CoA synthetase (AMP-forming)/AMP-acid ligase II
LRWARSRRPGLSRHRGRSFGAGHQLWQTQAGIGAFCRHYLVTLLAIWRLGAVHVPLFTAFAPPAIAYRLLGSNARLVVCDPAQQGKLAPCDAMPANAPWRVITTGPAADGALSFDRLMEGAHPDWRLWPWGAMPRSSIFTRQAPPAIQKA